MAEAEARAPSANVMAPPSPPPLDPADTLARAPYILACQNDSYQRELHATVLACHEISAWLAAYAPAAAAAAAATAKKSKKNKRKQKKGASKAESKNGGAPAAAAAAPTPRYGVLLSDTVLFPTGGGQPHDLGTLTAAAAAPAPVLDVVRLPSDMRLVLHYVPDPIPAGTAVTVALDGARRVDHMQQHSAQHPLTAVALPAWPTTTWNLSPNTPGASPCYLDLDVSPAAVGPAALADLEARVNARVRDNLAMTPRVYSPEEFAAGAAGAGVRSGSKGIKSGGGPVRTVTIEGVEQNTCCGTHVRGTAHLQTIKLLSAEKSPADKAHTRVWFLAGDRVLGLAGRLHRTSGQLTKLLTTGPAEHASRVAEVVAAHKELSRAQKGLLRTLAKAAAEGCVREAAAAGGGVGAASSIPLVVCHHLEEGTADYMKCFLREAGEATKSLSAAAGAAAVVVTIVVSTGGGKGKAGACMMEGEVAHVERLGPAVIESLGGRDKARGGGRGRKFQLKVEAGALTEKAVARMHALARELALA